MWLCIGWKMHRRMQGLEEFAFEQILNDADLPPIPTLQVYICILFNNPNNACWQVILSAPFVFLDSWWITRMNSRYKDTFLYQGGVVTLGHWFSCRLHGKRHLLLRAISMISTVYDMRLMHWWTLVSPLKSLSEIKRSSMLVSRWPSKRHCMHSLVNILILFYAEYKCTSHTRNPSSW